MHTNFPPGTRVVLADNRHGTVVEFPPNEEHEPHDVAVLVDEDIQNIDSSGYYTGINAEQLTSE